MQLELGLELRSKGVLAGLCYAFPFCYAIEPDCYAIQSAVVDKAPHLLIYPALDRLRNHEI